MIRNAWYKAGAATGVTLATLGVMAGVAGASPSPTEAGFTEMETEVGVIAPLFFSLAVVLIVIGLGYRWVKKGAKAG